MRIAENSLTLQLTLCHYNIVSVSKNIAVELHDWLPTSCRNVDGTDDYDIAALDATWPDPPKFASVIATSWI